jgi:S-DNA-T family DNA segregation ATPase FtsK/SpoIIIE
MPTQPRAVSRATPAPRKAGRGSAGSDGLQFLRRWGPDVCGLVLIAFSLVGLLALFRPEGMVAEPLGNFFRRGFGWLGGLILLWCGVLGVLVLSHRLHPSPWPWARTIAVIVGTLSLLALAELESIRREGLERGAGGGIVGASIASTLVAWFGTPSAWILLLIIVSVASMVVVHLSPVQLMRFSLWLGHWTFVGAQALWSRMRQPPLRINTADLIAQRPKRLPQPVKAAKPDPSDFTESAAETIKPSATEGKALQKDGTWRMPPVAIFQTRKVVEPAVAELRDQARVIEETLTSFNIQARVVEANQGPAVTQFGLEPAIGVPVARIQSRLNDIALRLGANSIRIEAPVPGRRMVGIEIPNANVSVVNIREVLESPTFDRTKQRIPLALGKDIAGKAMVGDLARMPHLLIAGATGSGKSVCINSIVACLLSKFAPNELQLIMIDPKMVELIAYNGVPHLRMPVVTEMDRVVGTLKWVIQEMENRYKLFQKHSARNIDGYNRLAREKLGERPMPYLVLIIDELADLMMTAPEDVEKSICRLAQLARATGIHLIVATQRPSVDVLTGLIKANLPTRIAFAVTSQVDSRVILDMVGAERLIGRGDMLYMPPDSSKPVRVQGTYVSDQEIEALVEHWRGLGSPQYDDADLADVELLGRPAEPPGDELFERAVALAQETSRLSVSLLQRRLGIGYPRAARLMDLLEEKGIVPTAEDGRARELTAQEPTPRS